MANKWTIFALIFVGYSMFTFNRKGVSYAVPSLLTEGFQRDNIGFILSVQNLAYLISKFLGGILSDKLSSRLLFGTGLIVSGFASFLFSGQSNLYVFVLCWFLNGLAQGLGWPAIAKLLKNWFESSELGTWWSLASASSNLSGCISPFIATYLTEFYGWRFSMCSVGLASMGMGSVCLLLMVDKPSKTSNSTGASPKKPKLERYDKVIDKESPDYKYSTKDLLSTPFIWVISLSYLIVSAVKTGLTDWSQVYLITECHQSHLVANSFLSTVEFGGLWGGIAAGILSDRFMKGGKGLPKRGHPRMIMGMVMNFMALIFMHLLYTQTNQNTSIFLLNAIGVVLGASIYGQIALYGIVATESVVSELSGSAHAIAALFANLGSMIAGFPFAYIAQNSSWSEVFKFMEIFTFVLCIFMLCTSTVSYQFLPDARKSEEKKKQ